MRNLMSCKSSIICARMTKGMPFGLAGLAMAITLMGGQTLAAPPDVPPGQPFQALEARIEALESAVGDISGQLDDLQDQVADVQDGVDALSNVLRLETRVDTGVCGSIATQCSGADHTFEAASDANHNPLRLFVQVVKNGVGVTGLNQADFSFSNSLVPAGASGAVFCSESVCTSSNFQVAANGLYAIFLDRAAAGNWKAGDYAGTVVVTDSEGAQGTALVTFTIPVDMP